MNTLLLYLAGPMQSWGYRSRFDNRDTGLEPTRSGVIGILCAALGVPRGEEHGKFDSLRMGVRIDHPGIIMNDFHTAMKVIRADGSLDKEENTVISSRFYLADARFLVGLESENLDLLKELESALKKPRWFIFLGRKSFTTSLPVCKPGSSIMTGKSLEVALKEEPWYKFREREKVPDESLRMVLETKIGEKVAFSLNDFPLDYKERKFTLRDVRNDWLKPEEIKQGGLHPCISQD